MRHNRGDSVLSGQTQCQKVPWWWSSKFLRTSQYQPVSTIQKGYMGGCMINSKRTSQYPPVSIRQNCTMGGYLFEFHKTSQYPPVSTLQKGYMGGCLIDSKKTSQYPPVSLHQNCTMGVNFRNQLVPINIQYPLVF